MPASRPEPVRGCVYWPHPAFNAWQLWADYDRERAERDLGRARRLGLNAVRVVASYELWAHDALALRAGERTTNRFLERFAHFLDAAAAVGVAVLPVLFEAVGDDPMSAFWDPEQPSGALDLDVLEDADVNTAFAVHSPSRSQVVGPRRWGRADQAAGAYAGSPLEFARRFTGAFGGHEGLLAVEAMNEPGGVQPRMDFAVDVAEAVRGRDASVSVTVGTKSIELGRVFHDAVEDGLDAVQFHSNFPPTTRRLRLEIEEAADFGAAVDRPVWLGEWQRTRTEPPSRLLPHYRSAAPVVRRAEDEGRLQGDFLWSLNVKPAYMERPRRRGRVNGVFHGDGSVFDAADAAAISGRADWTERRELPAWIRAGDHPWPAVGRPASTTDGAGGDEGLAGAVAALGVFALFKWLSGRGAPSEEEPRDA